MNKLFSLLSLPAALLLTQTGLRAEITVNFEHIPNDQATAAFQFKKVPRPSRSDAAQQGKFALADGERDENGGELAVLNDGTMPKGDDEPAQNFFFAAGGEGGRLVLDLGRAVNIKQINTYSWHTGTRAPQVYRVYASDGKAEGFKQKPGKGSGPEQCGWKLLAKVDTRPAQGDEGGQYGVSIAEKGAAGAEAGSLGAYQYVLFEISRTETRDPFGNTFYSEIDIVDRDAPAPTLAESAAGSEASGAREVVQSDNGKYEITIDTTETPDLTAWAREKIAPMVREWYPKMIALLPSEGYEAPARFSIMFSKDMQGVAATGGTRVRCAATWFRANLKGEAVGAVFHEMVHVVQQYGRGRRVEGATRPPGWLTEGMTDYLRWYVYEPESRGAEIRNLDRARYDGSYRVTANFLNWASEKYNRSLVPKLNAAIREGRYKEDVWKEYTGHTVEELGAEWKQELQARADANRLTEEEKAAGWQLLFNGKDFEGWRNFKREGVRPGWQVKDGALVCADPHNAGDLVTRGQYDWFELQLDYNISEGGNSGIIYHVTDEGNAVWATGPEVQLEDNAKASDPQRCGWLYALYQPAVDTNTGKPLDATKPAGQWNHMRILLTPAKCEHEVNGVKYFEYVLGSDDFKERVAKSKFGRMPRFAKSDKGYIALQGDHGQVMFRNIKLKPIPAK